MNSVLPPLPGLKPSLVKGGPVENGDKCATCFFWNHAQQVPGPEGEPHAICRRLPPVLAMAAGMTPKNPRDPMGPQAQSFGMGTLRPTLAASDWCGEFRVMG